MYYGPKKEVMLMRRNKKNISFVLENTRRAIAVIDRVMKAGGVAAAFDGDFIRMTEGGRARALMTLEYLYSRERVLMKSLGGSVRRENSDQRTRGSRANE